MAINPDGTRAYAAVRDPYSYDYKLSVIDIDPNSLNYNKEIAVINVPSSDGVVAVDVALNNDGSRAYVLNHDGKVVVIDTATNQIIGTFTAYEPGNYDISGSIDGRLRRHHLCHRHLPLRRVRRQGWPVAAAGLSAEVLGHR